ncbi:hypothetical protein CHLNCDRAFT_29893 [Chlorella variabilis]|uniref:HpcH/HpaI aldolase/citrate lyase domain-containing protein n=1 Tax=Chlorella variabilis TaxID=554065 RepID=E1Z666_CHLVA|nr:hypothetical protein CHLNCDRAFT_29893 [Chlorella variabilis]EFN58595.1 hypothetical protein CHLNCDRAFT_29893 [Chlorella variabilis]|eukprot:XP_005850697.1 hypothetical protein CHLNCDRAFT_29893 [Chlorella variabilis]
MIERANRALGSFWPLRGVATAAGGSVLELPPRRSLLYVPGDSDRKICKAAGLGADVTCLDLEDAVAGSRKEAARDVAVKALAQVSFGRSERAVRVNSIQSGLCEDDLRAVLTGEALPDALVVPKVDTVDHVRWLFGQAKGLLGSRQRQQQQQQQQGSASVALITMCESGMGLLNLRHIFEACLTDEHRQLLRLEACIFGADDYCASLGMKRQPGTDDTLFARRWVALHARAFGLQPIDQVYIDYKNTHALGAEALEGRGIGMAGKQVIHPSQIGPVQEAYSPDPREVEEASELVEAFEKHQEEGQGTFTFRDKMIDQPTYLQARNLLKLAQRVGGGGGGK